MKNKFQPQSQPSLFPEPKQEPLFPEPCPEVSKKPRPKPEDYRPWGGVFERGNR
jgi:hypothetical protein